MENLWLNVQLCCNISGVQHNKEEAQLCISQGKSKGNLNLLNTLYHIQRQYGRMGSKTLSIDTTNKHVSIILGSTDATRTDTTCQSYLQQESY